jgi:hypothetical protein
MLARMCHRFPDTRNSAPSAAEFSHSQFSSDFGWAYLVLILLGSHAYLGLD